MALEEEDPYAAMGVSLTATIAEVTKAYRRLAVVLHPDKNPNDATASERFRKMQLSYELLKDAEKRAAYDARIAVKVALRVYDAVALLSYFIFPLFFFAKVEKKRKLGAQDDRRRKMRGTLEERERAATERNQASKQVFLISKTLLKTFLFAQCNSLFSTCGHSR